MEKKKFAFPVYIMAALTWFGYHCGSGFASGRQVYLYAAKYGTKGWLSIVFSWVCTAVFMYIIMEFSRCVHAKSYRDVASGIYCVHNSIFSRVMILLWDIIMVLGTLVGTGACVAGCGTLLQELFGLPYMIGCAGFIILMLLILVLGEKALNVLGTISSPLIILFFIVAITGIALGWNNLTEVFTTAKGAAIAEDASAGAILNSGFTYTGIQISALTVMSIYGGKFASRKESIFTAVAGFLMNAGAMLVSFFAIMAFYPEISEAPMPILTIIRMVTGPFGLLLLIAYNFILVMAYITTAGAQVTGSIARYVPILNKKIPNVDVCRIIVSVVIMIATAVLSTLGLDGVLTKGYGLVSNLRKPLWFIPIIILGPIAIHMAMKKKEAENEK